LIVRANLVNMESPKQNSVIGILGGPTDLPLNQPISEVTKQDASARNSIQIPTTKRPFTVATSMGSKQAYYTPAANEIGSTDQEEHQTPSSPSSQESSDSPANDRQLLSEDPFASAQSKALFDAIDELRICGAGQDLDLPQVSTSIELSNLTSGKN
jgi:hypothetical protein